MSASKLRPPGKLTLEEILREAFARRRFDWLVDHGADRYILAAYLTRIPFASRVKPLVKGLDPRAVQKLPDDLGAMAWKLERLNASNLSPVEVLPKFPTMPLYGAEPIRTWATEGTQTQKAIAFSGLPTLLRELAGYIRACLAIRSTGRQQQRQTVSDRQVALLVLLKYVERETGTPRFQRVAGLVNSACAAAGTGTRGITARRLKSLWKNHWFTRLTIDITPGALPLKQAVTDSSKN